MMVKPKIKMNEIKKDFSFLKEELNDKDILAVLLYGSYVKNMQHIKSDVDICIVAPKYKTIKEQAALLRYLWRNVNTDKYDVRLFEELPLYIKARVTRKFFPVRKKSSGRCINAVPFRNIYTLYTIKNHKVIFTGDEKELKEYFYFTNKIWRDQSVNWIEKKV